MDGTIGFLHSDPIDGTAANLDSGMKIFTCSNYDRMYQAHPFVLKRVMPSKRRPGTHRGRERK